MCSFNSLNGQPGCANPHLETDILKKEWGFDGFVVSDANAVRNLVTHGFARDLAEAGARAVNAGVDMEMAIADPGKPGVIVGHAASVNRRKKVFRKKLKNK